MGNYDIRSIKFRQSVADFPLTVALGEKIPIWSLSRWNGNAGLRFVPPDDEGFSLRSNRRQLVYRGRQRSHRFTILGDGAFEYDCILEREPDSNVVSLVIEGAECFDFFRQPDFVSDPFLKGSYAVYKKETLLGEGTGKLCHIHRPEIIDARGRRCWGELSVVGNCLEITIPENWLSEAAYPVIVDPVIGTDTVGKQYLWEPEEDEGLVPLYFEVAIAVNRFLVAETIKGQCTAYFYTNKDDYEAGCRPVLYSENFNQPHLKKSAHEQFIDLRITGGNKAGWRSGTFIVDDPVQAGSYVWFGACTEYLWFTRFDYGACFYYEYWEDRIPDVFPGYDGISYPLDPNDFKLSMYFSYTSAQNYVLTLTQGVTLSDSRKLKADYKRNAMQTAGMTSLLNRYEAFYRNCIMTAHNTMNFLCSFSFVRSAIGNVMAVMKNYEARSVSRKCIDIIKIQTDSRRIIDRFRKVIDSLTGFDTQSASVLIVRSALDKVSVSHASSHLGMFLRSLKVFADNTAGISHKAKYYRHKKDTVQAEGKTNRALFVVIRIITQVFIRDFLLRRFLLARSELVIKSCITRELVVDSRIN